MPERILYVSAAGRIGGAENSLLQLVRGLDRCEFAPVVALPGLGPLADALERLGVPAFYAPLIRPRRTLNPVRLALMGGGTALGALCLAREARRRSVSVIHALNTAAQPAAGLAAAAAGLPCVWHLRDLRCLRVVTRGLARFAHAAIAVSDAVAKASAIGPGWGPQVTVVPNGIDADAFAARARPGRLRGELGLRPEDPLLVVVAQMVPWKGHRDFLHAMALVRSRHPQATAALAGDDLFGEDPGYLSELRRLAASLGLERVVRFLGYRTDVPTLVADADLLVIPSEAEPFGRVALEAMALGTPVVGRGAGGLPEVVEHGVTGRLTRGPSVEELAGLITDLLSDPEGRCAMGEAGYRRVRERFDLARHVERICAVYRRLPARRG